MQMHANNRVPRTAWLVAIAALTVLQTQARAVLNWNFNSPPANGYTIQEIIDNQGLRVGDKVFTSFDVVSFGTGGALAPQATDIRVRGFIEDDGSIGLDFNGAWFANIGQAVNTTIEFAVTADDPFVIDGVGLSLDAVGGLGNGAISIAEQVEDVPGGTVLTDPTLFVFYQRNNPFNQFDDFGSFDPIKSIYVTKDITVTSGGQGIAHLSKFSQTFRQVPEPGTLVLAAGGMLVVLTRRRRSAA